MLLRPGGDLVLVDPDLAVLDPGVELGQNLGVVVLADAGVEAVVPAVHAADDILAIDMAIGHQCPAVGAAPVEHADLRVVADDDQVDTGNEGMGWTAIFEIIHRVDRQGIHESRLRLVIACRA